jgi:hypothetical protein
VFRSGWMMKRLSVGLMAAVLAALVGCGPLKDELRGSELATGADAVLLADIQDDNRLTALTITVENLPPPDRIKAGLTTFVTGQRKDSATAWTRIGDLNDDADKRTGDLKGVTVPEMAFDFLVTAEPAPPPASPSEHIIFTARVKKG